VSAMAKERMHFGKAERRQMLQEETCLDELEVMEVVELTERFTFSMLKDLARVFGRWGRGREV